MLADLPMTGKEAAFAYWKKSPHSSHSNEDISWAILNTKEFHFSR